MPFWRTYYHLIWATKRRLPLIQPEIEPRLFAYLTNKAVELGIVVYAIGGWFDHVHMVVAIPPKLAVATAVKRLKGASSHFVNQSLGSADAFGWQRGYGVLTLGESQRARAEAYVRDQKRHHQEQSANRWLERADVLDEGPADLGIGAGEVPPVLQEGSAIYDWDLDDERPF